MQVDFYILEATSAQKTLHFACHLIEKIYSDQQTIYVQVDSQQEANRLDALLWTFRDISFLPHQLENGNHDDKTPILIGWGEIPVTPKEVLINLSKEMPSFYHQFKHVIEIVFPDPPVQQLARERYKAYREAGHEMNTHKIKP